MGECWGRVIAHMRAATASVHIRTRLLHIATYSHSHAHAHTSVPRAPHDPAHTHPCADGCPHPPYISRRRHAHTICHRTAPRNCRCSSRMAAQPVLPSPTLPQTLKPPRSRRAPAAATRRRRGLPLSTPRRMQDTHARSELSVRARRAQRVPLWLAAPSFSSRSTSIWWRSRWLLAMLTISCSALGALAAFPMHW